MDKYDIPFLIQDIKNEMPLFTDNFVKIKTSYSQGMPKNLSEYMDKVNEKFLDNSLATIEDYSFKNTNNELTQWFKDYQHRYFNSVLLKDSFLKIDEDGNFGTTRYYQGMGIKNAGFLGSLTNKVNGATLETTASPNRTDTMNDYLYSGRVVGTIGQYYDRIACDVVTGSGNINLAVYDELSSVPNALLASTGSIASPSSTTYTLQTLSEFSLTTTNIWLSIVSNNGTFTLNGITNQGIGSHTKDVSITFPTLPNPMSATYAGAAAPRIKIGHS